MGSTLLNRDKKVDQDLFEITEFIRYYVLSDILKSGEFKIYDKNNHIEKVIFIHHSKFCTVDEMHEYISYSFSSGTEFMVDIISI